MLRIGRILLLLFFVHPVAQGQFRVVGYINTWDHFPDNLSAVAFDKITHINVAFAQPDTNGDLRIIKRLPEAVKQAQDHGVKILISLGGADLGGTEKFWRKFTEEAQADLFTDKILHYLLQYGLDGVDIDLEGNVIGSRYGPFIRLLSAKLKPAGKLLTAAVATWFEEQIPPGCFQYFDFVNIMSFDLTGPGNDKRAGQHSPFSLAVSDIAFWKKKGLPREKIGLGIPFYGYRFSPGAKADEIPFRQIVTQYPGGEGQDKVGHTIYYNGMPTIAAKTRLAIQEAGGLMIWELTGDASGDKSLLRVIDSVLRTTR